jgi:hypothetical protein
VFVPEAAARDWPDDAAGPDDEVSTVILKPLDRPEDDEYQGTSWRQTVTGETIEPEAGPAPDDAGRLGQWLLLRDAVRVIGSLERLYRMAEEGILLSRVDPDGEIEIWVPSSETYAASDASDPDRPTEPPGPRSVDASELSRVAAALIKPLAEAHERHLQLARENGSLSARVITLEIELREARAQATDQAGPRAAAQAREIELARDNAVLVERLAGLERLLDDARAHADGSLGPLSDAQERQIQLARENGALGERLTGLERELAETRTQVADLAIVPAEAAEQQRALSQENTALAERLADREREIERLRVAATESTAPLAEARERQMQLAIENDALSERLAALEREVEEARARQSPSSSAPPAASPAPSSSGEQPTAQAARKPIEVPSLFAPAAGTPTSGRFSRELALDDERGQQGNGRPGAAAAGAQRSGGMSLVLIALLLAVTLTVLGLGARWLVTLAS